MDCRRRGEYDVDDDEDPPPVTPPSSADKLQEFSVCDKEKKRRMNVFFMNERSLSMKE